MNALTSKSSFGKAATGLMAVAALTSALTLAPANDVEAQQPQNVSTKPYSQSITGTMKECSNYAKSGGIGVIVNYGPQNSISADEVGSKFVQGFAKRGADAKYFVVPSSAPGASVSFCVGSLLSDPQNISDAVKSVDEMIKLNRGYKSIVAGVDLNIN